jgi:hypothetical protein
MSCHAARLVSLTLAAAALSACGATPRLPVPDEAVVHFGNEAAAAVIVDGTVELQVAVPGAASPATITSGAGRAGDVSVRLLSYGGETGEEYNTFVYGTAPAGATSVSLFWPSGTVGGQVWGGAWLIVLREKDVTPGQLHWRFRSADGGLVASGDGILNP